MAWCGPCNRYFVSELALTQHFVQSPLHEYCQRCDEHFVTPDNLQFHYRTAHAYCPVCKSFFQNALGLHEHYRQSSEHYNGPPHHYCASCMRLFSSASNLNSHLNSSVHRPRDVPCFGKGCSLTFVSRAAAFAHLESGRCPSRMDRQTLNRLLRQYDTNNVITKPSRMLEYTETTYYATERAFNGLGYECYLCHHEFRTLQNLNKHLASPRHQQKIYVCPLNVCRVSFATLSGLCQHIESGRCGVLKFKVVQDAMDQLMGKMKGLTF
ncbi:Zinc finger protein [Mycena sanguinolenta]|uniref:Zinc finger protein n=1 Tax=Mycena sanguinolenta TaxID=230812 RepID=A0A8H6X793_9AGAR|nr:Zinc finger protein [Mycena sanguinolenta]